MNFKLILSVTSVFLFLLVSDLGLDLYLKAAEFKHVKQVKSNVPKLKVVPLKTIKKKQSQEIVIKQEKKQPKKIIIKTSKKKIIKKNLRVLFVKLTPNYEINNKELLKHNGYKFKKRVKQIKWASYLKTKKNIFPLEKIKKIVQIKKIKRYELQDLISLKQSSVKKNNYKKKIIKAGKNYKIPKRIMVAINQIKNNKNKILTIEAPQKTSYSIAVSQSFADVEIVKIQEMPAKLVLSTHSEMSTQKKEVAMKQPVYTGAVSSEYSANEGVVSTNPFKKQKTFVSDSVKNVISREMSRTNNNNENKKYIVQNRQSKDIGKLFEDNVKHISSSIVKNEKTRFKKNSYEYIISLNLAPINLGKDREEIEQDFDVLMSYDENERYSSDLKKGLELKIKSRKSFGETRYKVLHAQRGYVETVVNQNFNHKHFKIKKVIPILAEENLQYIYEDMGMHLESGMLILEKDHLIYDIDIDTMYDGKKYLDQNLRITESIKESKYVFFYGVKPGNTMIKVVSFKKQNAQKIIYIAKEKLTYESISLQKKTLSNYDIFEKKLFSKKDVEYISDGETIRYLNSKYQGKNIGDNRYQIKIPPTISEFKKYLEFSHIHPSIFVNVNNKTKVTIPAEDYLAAKLQELDLDLSQMQGTCLAQININDIDESYVSMETSGDYENHEVYYFDRDGFFSKSPTIDSVQIFILAGSPGIFNLKIDHFDKESTYIKTFCSPNRYIIENY